MIDQDQKEFEFSSPPVILNEKKTNPNLDEEISFSCRQCYKSFEEPRFLILHISTEHNNDCNAKSTKNQDRNEKNQKNQKKKINQKNHEQLETNQKIPISEIMPTMKNAFVAKSLCNFEKNSALEKVIFCQEILEKHSYKVDNSKNFPDLNLNLNLPLNFTISKSKSKNPNPNLNPKTVSSHVHKKNKHKHKKFGSKALLEKHREALHSTTSKRSKPSKTNIKYQKKNFKGIEFQVLDEIE